MKYIITESKLEQVAIKYLNKMYGNLEEYRTDEYPDKVFYMKGNKVYMELYVSLEEYGYNFLYVEYETIWGDLQHSFSLKTDEIRQIITKWMEETYHLDGNTLEVEECSSRFFTKL